MDPNACLEAVRAAYRSLDPLLIDTPGTGPDKPDLTDAASELAERFEDLDAWLSRGGAAPAVWTAVAR